MKRLFLIAAFSIALLTLLAACGGGSSEDQPSSQETSSSTGIVEPTSQETSSTGASPTVASVVDPEGRVQTYLALMDQLATALKSMDTTDLSADALDPITEITDDLEDYSEFFNGLNETGRNYVFGTYGVELRQSAETVVTYALAVQERRGDEAISQALARLPAFAITTTNTGTGSTTTEPAQVLAGGISTLLTVDDVAGLAVGVGLLTRHLDLKSMAANADPAQVEHIVSFDSLFFDTADGSQGLTLTVIKLDSDAAASDRMELMVADGLELQHFTEDIGDVSGFVEANEGGIGIMVVFKKGEWVIMVHTAQPDGETPLVDVSGLEALARMVADRL